MNVSATYNLDSVNDIVGIFLKQLLQFRVNGQHGRYTVRISGVHAHSIHILDETDGNLLALGIPHHFQFQFLPSQD